MRRPLGSITLAAALLMLASTTLVGCTIEHGEPWTNPGQQERLGELNQRDEQTEQQLRDRVLTGQTQR